MSIAVVIAFNFVLEMMVEIINLVFVGHLGNTALVAGVGLGNMYANTVAFSVVIGLNNGTAIFISQCYG